jgi:DNA-binding CsgD family transcriptional regulator/PAS domain-containing protein
VEPDRLTRLLELIYDAAVDSRSWAAVMAVLKEQFVTSAETFYFLDFPRHAMRSLHVGGIAPSFYRSFSDRYFTPDNPWIHAEPLHRPGVIRTDERLQTYFKDAAVLRRSEYYNDWLRPQGLHHSLGTTLRSERGTIANLTLLRPADAGRYDDAEIAAFELVCGHLRRALSIAVRLETLGAREQTTSEALDALPYGILIVDVRGKLVRANRRGDVLLRRGDGLTLRHGRLAAIQPREAADLDRVIGQLAGDPAAVGASHMTVSRRRAERPLTISAIGLGARHGLFGVTEPTILLLVVDPDGSRPTHGQFVRKRYGRTQPEARLALALLAGHHLRRAADEARMTYETARWYLKIVFQKTETRRQSELVARMLRDMALPLGPSTSLDAPVTSTSENAGD